MSRALTADDILPLVAALAPVERVRLLEMIASPKGRDDWGYASTPPGHEEFAADDESLAWDAEGWENAG